jgi:hypothetical protein
MDDGAESAVESKEPNATIKVQWQELGRSKIFRLYCLTLAWISLYVPWYLGAGSHRLALGYSFIWNERVHGVIASGIDFARVGLEALSITALALVAALTRFGLKLKAKPDVRFTHASSIGDHPNPTDRPGENPARESRVDEYIKELVDRAMGVGYRSNEDILFYAMKNAPDDIRDQLRKDSKVVDLLSRRLPTSLDTSLESFMEDLKKGTFITLKYRDGNEKTMEFVNYERSRMVLWIKTPGSLSGDTSVGLKHIAEVRVASLTKSFFNWPASSSEKHSTQKSVSTGYVELLKRLLTK